MVARIDPEGGGERQKFVTPSEKHSPLHQFSFAPDIWKRFEEEIVEVEKTYVEGIYINLASQRVPKDDRPDEIKQKGKLTIKYKFEDEQLVVTYTLTHPAYVTVEDTFTFPKGDWRGGHEFN